MTDRLAQARDAYWNTHPYTGGAALDVDTLRFGVEWADANPQPHTITRAKAVADSHPDPRCDRYGTDDAVTCGWKGAYTDMLDALGIEVGER